MNRCEMEKVEFSPALCLFPLTARMNREMIKRWEEMRNRERKRLYTAIAQL
jgi:hypothetical protein